MKFKITASVTITVLGFLLFGIPTLAQPALRQIFLRFPFSKTSVDFITLLHVSLIGTILFVISVIGRFEEHKVNVSFRNYYNKQINLLTQFSNVSATYFIYMILILLTVGYYTDSFVLENLKTVLYSLLMVSNCYLLFLIIKVLIFEEFVDNRDIERHFKEYGLSETILELLKNT